VKLTDSAVSFVLCVDSGEVEPPPGGIVPSGRARAAGSVFQSGDARVLDKRHGGIAGRREPTEYFAHEPADWGSYYLARRINLGGVFDQHKRRLDFLDALFEAMQSKRWRHYAVAIHGR
jgi:hypothetical protein